MVFLRNRMSWRVVGRAGVVAFALAGLGAGADLGAADAPEVYQRHCVACHASMTGGDGRVLYTRADRLVRDKRALVERVEFCRRSLGLQWTGDEVRAVGDYLNREFYRFP